MCLDNAKKSMGEGWPVDYTTNLTANSDKIPLDLACKMMSNCGWPEDRGQQGCANVLPFNFPSLKDDYPRFVCSALYSERDSIIIPGVPKYNTTIYNQKDVSCPLSNSFGEVLELMDKGLVKQQDEDYMRPLSVLFNAFIMMQLANEVNARRINDEYTIFVGLFDSPVFISVIIITLGLQAIIINALGMFFKVERLDGYEWLATFGIGAGAWPVSLLTRFVSRVLADKARRKQEEEEARARATGPGKGNGSMRGSNRVHSTRGAVIFN